MWSAGRECRVPRSQSGSCQYTPQMNTPHLNVWCDTTRMNTPHHNVPHTTCVSCKVEWSVNGEWWWQESEKVMQGQEGSLGLKMSLRGGSECPETGPRASEVLPAIFLSLSFPLAQET